MSALLEAALAYAAEGLAVHPLKPGGKAPLLPHGLKDATTDHGTIIKWWWQWPDANIGIVVPEGVVVVDIDPRNGGSTDSLTWWGSLPEGRSAKTGGGGWHVWFQAPEEKLTSQLPGIDIKTHKGYVVAPPSVTDGPYEWVDYLEPQPFPRLWIDQGLFTKPTPEPMFNSPERAAFDDRQREWAEGRRRISLEDHGASIADHYSATATWRELLEEHGWQLVSGDGEEGSRWRHPEATADFSATITNDCLFVYSTNTPFEATEAGEPHGYTKFAAYSVFEHEGDMSRAARALRPAQATSWGNPEWPATDDPFGEAPETALDRLRLVDWPELWRADFSAEDWLIEPVLGAGRGHAIFAKAGGAKSWLVLQLVAALAAGRAVLRRPEGNPVGVLYLDYEMTRADLRDRLDGFGYDEDADLSRLHYAQLPEIPALDTWEGGALIRRAARELGVGLVVIDTTARAIDGEENSADTYKAFYRFTGAPLKSDGVAWLRLDHAGKDLTKGQRGSSSKNDDVDVVWQLERRDNNALRLEGTKRRMPWVPAIVELTEVETDLGPTYVVPAQPTQPDKTYDIVRLLERLEVPIKMGRPKVRALIEEHGIKARNDAISAALRIYRENVELGAKTCPEGAGQVLNHLRNGKAGQFRGTVAKPLVEARDSLENSTSTATCPEHNPNVVGYAEGAPAEGPTNDDFEGLL